MKTKILYTDGQRTVEMFWLNHTGTDVYCGSPKSDFKRSYHASGQLHTKDGTTQFDPNWVAPLKNLRGTFHLMTMGFTNSTAHVKAIRPDLEFTRRKLDAALFIDARSIPENIFVNVMIGLVEPGNSAALGFLANLPNVKQLLLGTQVAPWVSVGVVWPADADDAQPVDALEQVTRP